MLQNYKLSNQKSASAKKSQGIFSLPVYFMFVILFMSLFLRCSSTASIITGNPSINSLNGNAETISIASSPKPDRPRRQRRRDPVNINTASIFQLMTVDGITQELAAHLVHYREKKVSYKYVAKVSREICFFKVVCEVFARKKWTPTIKWCVKA